MFARAVLAFLAMPAVAGILVPLWIARGDPWRGPGHRAGAVLASFGLAGLLWCVRDFYATGKGTLAPWSPPSRLVVVGLYRFARNPMYLSVLVLVAGIAAWRGSPAVAVYTACLALAFHLRVVLNEERWLARTFPAEWDAYARAVPRWVPRLAPWRGAGRAPRSSARIRP
jgi:protein-S-isoprenylcysteine O-methyltransferase Ste14